MLGIEISHPGGPEVLRPADFPKPVPGDSEVLVRVEAAGVSRADTLQRKGYYPPPPGVCNIPGLDISGVVQSTGNGVENLHPGDHVCAIVAGGGYAQYCAVPAVQVLPIPEGWSAIEAASLPENVFTVYDNMITRAGLQAGDTVLIHGGTSGIGTMAIMLARAWRAVPIVTAGTDEKCAACLALGAEHAINYKTSDFVAEAQKLTNGTGVNVILDLVGGAYLQKNIEALAVEGRLSIIATQGGRSAELDIQKLMQKRARVLGSTMRARTPAQKGEVAQCLLRDVWPLLPARNPIRPIIDKVFPLAEARLAHERLETGLHFGKIVLTTE
ncbi:MAG TPA: NAD(P)H-quinone oxidoreductase [Bryobacteraceae bacterium]|nr:NAD(P)H-quinone oxidoreductase [Bryobacteraceae bacterium]